MTYRHAARVRNAGLPLLLVLLLAASTAEAGFTTATKHGSAKTCPAGSFLDLRLDDLSAGSECWSCPSGYIRTLDPVTSGTACAKPGGESFQEADYKHKWFCDGSKGEFFDPRKGGECWSCPKGKPRRTAYAVTSNKACATKEIIGERLGKASFEHKSKGCTGGAFFDPRKGGECWKCPSGYSRTAYAVTDAKACSKARAGSESVATRVSRFGCEPGQFLDPRNGGECWSCPNGKFRTVNAVNGPRACSDTVLEIFAADTKVFCRQLVGALARGDQGFSDLEKLITPYIDMVKKPVEDKVDELSSLVGDVDELERLMDQTIGKLDRKVLDDSLKFAEAVGGSQKKIKAILLDANLVCDGTPKQVDERIRALDLTSGISQNFVAISAGGTFVHTTYKLAVSVSVTWATNLSGDGGLYVSAGLGATSSAEPASFAIGAMFFPDTQLADFGLDPAPGLTVSVGKGPSFDKVLEKVPAFSAGPAAAAISSIDSVEIGWNWDPGTLPTLGFSKGLIGAGGGKGLLEVSASGGWDFPVLTYTNWTPRL